MSDVLVLKSQRFRSEREADWKRLESLLELLETGRMSRLSDDDVIALPVLYRATLSSLSVARSISLDHNLVVYLESLATRAYFFVYGSRTTLGERLLAFFLRDWPAAVRRLWRETLVSTGFCMLGAAVAAVLVNRSPDWFFAFVPSALAAGREPSASSAMLKASLFNHDSRGGLAIFASLLFAHNSQIALFAFALGFACCLPTALLMLYNGFSLGAFVMVFASHGLLLDFLGWTLVHGVTELFAVILAGAAGFHIGWSIAFPRHLSRLDAAAAAGRTAATVMAGVVLMLAMAGMLEGFGRQLIQSTAARYGVATVTAIGWGLYFYRPGRGR